MAGRLKSRRDFTTSTRLYLGRTYFLYLTLNAIDFYGDYRDNTEGEWGNFHVKLRGPK